MKLFFGFDLLDPKNILSLQYGIFEISTIRNIMFENFKWIYL